MGTLKELDAAICAITPQLQEASRPLIAPEVQVLFVTPREGNTTWSDTTDGDPRHG
jgi:hypothetical protein